MTHDSRRYHRTRRPTLARAYGMLGALGGALEGAGSAVAGGLESAAGAVGSGLESAAGAALGGAGKTALSGLESVGTGLKSLFNAPTSEAGYLQSLGQAVPEGVDIVGPSPTFTGPGFLGSVAQGFVHGPQQYASPSAATSLGQGVGGLLSFLDQLNAQRQPLPGQMPGMGGQSLRPIVNPLAQEPLQGPRVIPGGSAQPGQGNIMKMLGQILAAI